MASPLDDQARKNLSDRVSGSVLGPEDEGFDEAREVWNARFDRRPDLILVCEGTADVVAGVDFARERRLLLSVKSGGHDYAGRTVGEGGLLIDLGRLQEVSIDAAARRAMVGAGVTWGRFDQEAQAHGLATPGGTVSTVGVAGFTLGGGSGWLTRKHGLAADNLISAEVVTASGEVVRASDDENPDLFWALRGGGGNLGVVTSFEFELHEVGPDLLAGQVIYPAGGAKELLRAYRDWSTGVPDEVSGYAFFFRIPPIPDFPEELHGQLVLDFVVGYAGEMKAGEEVVAPLRSLGTPIADTIGPTPYLTLQQSFDAGVGKGNRWYTRSQYIEDLSDELIDALVDGLEPFPGDFTMVYLGVEGGAAGRRPTDAIAFPHRSASHFFHVWPGWMNADQDAEVMAWARGLHDAVRRLTRGDVYVNMLGEDEQDRLSEAYRGNLERLAAVKRRWDPDNLFRMNHNIAVSG